MVWGGGSVESDEGWGVRWEAAYCGVLEECCKDISVSVGGGVTEIRVTGI